MPKPVCVKCQCFYRPKKNGTAFIEMMPKGTHPRDEIRGTRKPEAWQPYKLWNGDLWECPDCGHEIVIGALSVVKEHFESDFGEYVLHYDAQLKVNDC